MSNIKRFWLAVFPLVLIVMLAGCASEDKRAEKVVYKTLESVLTITDRPLSSKIADISYIHTGTNKPGEKKAYYINGYVTVRRVALKDFRFENQAVPKGSSQDYKYYYEARVVQGVKHELVIVPSGLVIKKADG